MPKTDRPPLSAEQIATLESAGTARTEANAALKLAVLDALATTTGSVREIAEHAGISTNTVSRWKRGD